MRRALVAVLAVCAVSAVFGQDIPPTPAISSISPSMVAAGSADFDLVINGANFIVPVSQGTPSPPWVLITKPGTEMSWWINLPTATATRLVVRVPAAVAATAGVANVTVMSSYTEASSNEAPLTIVPVPSIASVNPNPAPATCNTGFTLTVSGTNFWSGAVVRWQSARSIVPTPLQTNVVSSTQLVAQVPPGLLLDTGSVLLTVMNPANAASAPFSYQVAPADLALGSLQPRSATAGGSAFSLIVSGTGFVSAAATGLYGGSIVQWTGPDNSPRQLPTTYVNACQLVASVPPDLIAIPGTANVAVANPYAPNTAGPMLSNSLPLSIAPAPLKITTAALPNGTAGVAYSQSLAATGGVTPYAWSIAAGALPAGVTLAANGTLSGTPSANGTFNFTARVTDSTQTVATQALSLVVAPAPLAITTNSPLPAGTSGTAYSQKLAGAGGTPPYTWSLAGGALPSGLALNGATGEMAGTPGAALTASFTVKLADSKSASVTKSFTLVVSLPALSITTQAPLAIGAVGVSYSQGMAATGGAPPYTWSVADGVLPTGLTLDSATGAITGKPGGTGTFTFTVGVADTQKNVATQAFSIQVNAPPLAIVTAPPLAAAVAGTAYSQAFSATGGRPPYRWSAEGSLPAGLSVDSASGALGGTPATPGTYDLTIVVTDAGQAMARRAYTIAVGLPPVPAIAFRGLSDVADPEQQPKVGLALGAPYPYPITGQITLTFTPDAAVPVDDPAIVFPNNSRTMDFTIPANAISSNFGDLTDVPFRTGTVAGTITLTASLRSGSVDMTPSPAPSRTVRVNRTAPTVTKPNVTAVRTAGGIEVRIVGFATPRQVTQAKFRFTAGANTNLQTAEFTVDLTNVFATWYRDAASGQYGSAFRYVQPFSVQGDPNTITSVTVTLSNAQGDSQPVTVSF